MENFLDFLNKIPTGTTALIASFSLLVSLLAFIRPWVKELLDAKKSKITETFKEGFQRGMPQFFVVSNLGPSDATNLKIRFIKPDGEDFNIFLNQDDSNIAILASNSQISIPVTISKYQKDRVTVIIDWDDKRIKRQSKKNTLGFWSLPM